MRSRGNWFLIDEHVTEIEKRWRTLAAADHEESRENKPRQGHALWPSLLLEHVEAYFCATVTHSTWIWTRDLDTQKTEALNDSKLYRSRNSNWNESNLEFYEYSSLNYELHRNMNYRPGYPEDWSSERFEVTRTCKNANQKLIKSEVLWMPSNYELQMDMNYRPEYSQDGSFGQFEVTCKNARTWN